MTHTLYMSARSPFARRVRLALEELGVAYSTEVLDIFNLPTSYDEINPLRRVPVLKTPEGALIVDSWMILDYLRSRFESHPLFLFGGTNAAEARGVSGLAVGVMEHIVAAYLESLRGPQMSREHYDEAFDNGRRGFLALERRVAAAPGPHLWGAELRLADLDLGTAVAYAKLRLPGMLAGCPALDTYLARLDRRESFRKTAPPA